LCCKAHVWNSESKGTIQWKWPSHFSSFRTASDPIPRSCELQIERSLAFVQINANIRNEKDPTFQEENREQSHFRTITWCVRPAHIWRRESMSMCYDRRWISCSLALVDWGSSSRDLDQDLIVASPYIETWVIERSQKRKIPFYPLTWPDRIVLVSGMIQSSGWSTL
jgi:hypothetical protein